MKRFAAMILAACLGSTLCLHGCAALSPPASRSQDLPKFAQVDEQLYRGGQPTAEGFRRLAERGVRTVIDLRAEHGEERQWEQRLVESLGMRWVHLPMHLFWRPTDQQVQTFLSVVSDPQQGPVFIHCRQGEDRTGVMVAIYRVVKQGWSPPQAYAEARKLGLNGWNPFMRYVVLHEIEREYLAFQGR